MAHSRALEARFLMEVGRLGWLVASEVDGSPRSHQMLLLVNQNCFQFAPSRLQSGFPRSMQYPTPPPNPHPLKACLGLYGFYKAPPCFALSFFGSLSVQSFWQNCELTAAFLPSPPCHGPLLCGTPQPPSMESFLNLCDESDLS